MDLSQQELPLTTYFTRGSKEARPRTIHHKTTRPAEKSHSAAPSPKRRRTKQCATAGSSRSHTGSAKPTLQLPTPAASARKRVRGGRLQDLPVASTGRSSSSVEPNTTPEREKHLAQPNSGPTPSKPPQLCVVETAAKATLGTPSTDRGRKTEPIGIVFSPGRRLPSGGGTYIVTPRTSSRRAPKSMHGINDHSPLTRSNRRSPPKPNQATSGSSYSPVDIGCSDPFHTYEKDSRTLSSREDISPPLNQRLIQWETSYDQASNDPLIPAIPVPSSQSQYLLHLDATPKHKRHSRRIEHVVSSQIQEEVELMLLTSCNPPAATIGSSVWRSPAKNTQVPRVSSKRERPHVYALSPTSVGSPVNSPPKESHEIPSKISSPSGRNTSMSSHSPSCKGKNKTVQSPTHHGSTENVPSAYIEESLTESESELDIPLVPPRASAPKGACTPMRCRPAHGNIPSTGDDSATEAESDTEFRKCLAEIGRKPPVYRPEVSKEDPLPPPVISPLVSPARPRIVTGPSSMKFMQFSTQEGAGLSAPGSCLPFASVLEQIQARSGSLPSIVRDFACMFPGDESYPADFPESLRV